jgi:hypothetical protein
MGGADYDFFLKDRRRVPSWLTACLPGGAPKPAAEEVQALLESLPVVRIGEPRAAEHPGAAWELEAAFTFEHDEPPAIMRLWAAPSDDLSDLHVEWLGVTKEEHEAAKRSAWTIGVSTTFSSQPLRDFHRQIRVLNAAAPGAVLAMDVPACRPHPASWLRESAASAVPPAPTSLFVIHAVYDDKAPGAPVWMHTHGLQRCGSIELEIMDVTRDDAATLALLVNTVAAMFIEKGPSPPDRLFHAGKGLDLLWLPWEDGLRKVGGKASGGMHDRDDAHVGPSGLLFVPSKGLFGRRYKSPSAHVPVLAENPLLYVSRMETERMALLAQDRWGSFVELQRSHGEHDDWAFLVKLGYPVDGAETDADREHLWFQVHDVRGNDLDATLTNEPYAVSTLRKDERGRHPLSFMTDWAILNPMGHFTPDTLYLLRRRLTTGP